MNKIGKRTAILITVWVMCMINVALFKYLEVPEGTFTLMSLCLPIAIVFSWWDDKEKKEK